MGAHAVATAVLLIIASALIWVGVAFAGYAIFLAFEPHSGAPWAAAFAAAILVIGPLAWTVIMNVRGARARAPLHAPEPRAAPAPDENATLSLLAKVAQEKPLLALVFAGIIGASEAILHRRDDAE